MKKGECISGNMWKCCIIAVLTVPILCMIGTDEALAKKWTGNANLFLGAKALNEDDWKPADEQTEAGIEVDFKQMNWAVSIAIDIMAGTGSGTAGNLDVESETTEFNIGAKKIWDNSREIRPFIGLGISFITAEIKTDFSGITISSDDSATGFWISGGTYWTLNKHFNIGIELKYSSAEVTIVNVDAAAGGGHAGLLLGYHW